MLELKNIKKRYKVGNSNQLVLDSINLSFKESEFVSILGPSGSGKTTLLNIIGGLDKYDSGDLIINGMSTKKFKEKDYDYYRNNSIGFIFQSYNLISHMNVLSNVELCMTLSGISKKERKKRALEALEKVGLKNHIYKKPNQLSGGQMQRVAIARALVNNPDIILADEPTGALDSKTSIQIMELIKEISNDKLVIMVTHNPELAREYSNRIIELKDGKVINDSNKEDENNEVTNYKLKKTSMNFFTALNLSFNNILTKKGRTFITAFASSIGIIGIALILSLSNGFKLQIDKYEKNTLSQAPIVISEESMDSNSIEKVSNNDNKKEYSNEKKIYAEKTFEKLVHKNNITNEYMTYFENMDKKLVGGVSYTRLTSLNLLTKKDDKVMLVDTTRSMAQIPTNFDGQESTVMSDNFEIIEGKYATSKDELMILVDNKNQLSSTALKAIGIDSDTINFSDLINKEFKVILNKDYYEYTGINYVPKINLDELYDNNNAITLKIVGIIRGKKNSDFAKLSSSGITYTKSLVDYIINENKNSDIVKKQQEVDYNVITLEKFSDNMDNKTTKNQTLAYLGDNIAPSMIQLYPKDFDSKEKIVKYLDKYNKGKSTKDKIVYLDQSKLITSLSGNIMDGITIVLIAFSAISLVVSSIMIGIIIYISVLERTKEIGILRSIGARKKDIRRVFNAETFIIGLSSGVIGILIAILLTLPINAIIKSITKLENVAQLNIMHGIILIIISITLTLIGGAIPASIASKKNPVESLRSE